MLLGGDNSAANWLSILCLAFVVALSGATAETADPVVSNIQASQRIGTKLVDITYDLADADSASLTVTLAISTDGGASFIMPGASLSGAVGGGVSPGAGKQVVWNAGSDLSPALFSNVRIQITACDLASVPAGMVPIPAGSFTMGDTFSEGNIDERPTHTVEVSAFSMEKYEVTKALWDEVYTWAIGQGYTFDLKGSGKAANHPVHSVYWYDVVKWCNARSQKAGLTPVYYLDAAMTQVYKSGHVAPYVKWTVRGYRLPTEAEWEFAARGGASAHRFPWTDADTITHSRANYYSLTSYPYDISSTRGYHPAFNEGIDPFPNTYTSPVGYFAPNGYGLYDMAGNVSEWCWDWYGSYASGAQTDPRGPSSGSDRVNRGGGWNRLAEDCRSANRDYFRPVSGWDHIGFRVVLAPSQ